MTASKPQEYLSITSEELLIVEHGCIYPDKDECIGKHCKYHDPNPSFRDNVVCLLNEHDVADRVRSRPRSSQPVSELPENYWYCPFRKGCEDGESYCDWPCDKWATWHDDNIRKAERERVLDEARFLIVNKTLPKEPEAVKLKQTILGLLESLRGGEP